MRPLRATQDYEAGEIPSKQPEGCLKSLKAFPRRCSQVLLSCALCIFFLPASAQTLRLGTVLNGTPPSSTGPWLTATFTTLFPGEVRLTLESHLDVSSEFIGEVALNINPTISPADLIFAQVSGVVDYRIQQPATHDSISLSGGGSSGRGFEISIDFVSGPGLPRFDGLQTCAFTIGGPATLTADDFLFHDSINNQEGPVIMGAHIQGILPGGGTTSSTIMETVPEPGSGALVILAVLMAVARGRCPNSRSLSHRRVREKSLLPGWAGNRRRCRRQWFAYSRSLWFQSSQSSLSEVILD